MALLMSLCGDQPNKWKASGSIIPYCQMKLWDPVNTCCAQVVGKKERKKIGWCEGYKYEPEVEQYAIRAI